ncbi:uncharacterized protein PV06_08773 [Exophiala oligosperma]|uniref:Uncharacterized protein n=1 Tax=Exophiala oligosperma TaxID=215243 RepID=A0A0D2D714_9EURO|nr:uncharacterized protein PV06_08773 [Exophiala oligosperma]KIW38953.1 hypothetical protein PV06_08773 [Exophiala oligosperma]
MGLIKTAIISGVAIYGVNKLAKSSENKRRDQQQSDNYYRDHQAQSQPRYRDMGGMMDDEYYYNAPSRRQEKGQPREMNFVDRRSAYPSDYDRDRQYDEKSQQQSPLYLQNDPRSPLPGSLRKDYTMSGGYGNDDGTTQQPPPQYEYNQYRPTGQRYPQRSGFVEPDELSESDIQSRNGGAAAPTGRGSGSVRNGASSMLNNLADFLNGDGKNGNRNKMFAK